MRASTSWKRRWKSNRRPDADARFAGPTLLLGGVEFLATRICPIWFCWRGNRSRGGSRTALICNRARLPVGRFAKRPYNAHRHRRWHPGRQPPPHAPDRRLPRLERSRPIPESVRTLIARPQSGKRVGAVSAVLTTGSSHARCPSGNRTASIGMGHHAENKFSVLSSQLPVGTAGKAKAEN